MRQGIIVKTKTKQTIRIWGWIFFMIYVCLLLYFLFFAEWYGRKNWGDYHYRYNLILFKEIKRFWMYREQLGMTAVMLNLAGNVIGFLPFGFILPIIGRRMRSIFRVTLLGFLLSLAVELLQLVFKVGCCDVDDLLLNTAGAFIGYIMFAVCNRIRRWKYGKAI